MGGSEMRFCAKQKISQNASCDKRWKKSPTQDKIQHLDFTKDPRPLYYKTPSCVFYHKNVRKKCRFRSLVRTKLALSKTGRSLSKAEILGVGVFSPLSKTLMQMSKEDSSNGSERHTPNWHRPETADLCWLSTGGSHGSSLMSCRRTQCAGNHFLHIVPISVCLFQCRPKNRWSMVPCLYFFQFSITWKPNSNKKTHVLWSWRLCPRTS